jgi:dihydrofolate reductase
MRKIVATLLVSLDGVVEAPQRWHLAYMDAELAAADVLLLGRATYEELHDHWFADYVVATPKVVDELRLLLHPVVAGRGRRLFEHVTDQRRLELVSSQRSAAGVLDITYRAG